VRTGVVRVRAVEEVWAGTVCDRGWRSTGEGDGGCAARGGVEGCGRADAGVMVRTPLTNV